MIEPSKMIPVKKISKVESDVVCIDGECTKKKNLVCSIPEKRMASAEQRATLELHAIIAQMKYIEDGVGPRIKRIKGGMGLLHSARGLLTRLANELALSAPKEQRDHLGRQLYGLYMNIGVRDKIGQQKRDGEIGRLLTFNEMDVVASAIKECCTYCTIEDPQEQKKCKYCKLLEVLPTNKSDEHAKGCGYFTVW